MTPLTFSLLMLGVLLNAAAQLLLKAGTTSVGASWRGRAAVRWPDFWIAPICRAMPLRSNLPPARCHACRA